MRLKQGYATEIVNTAINLKRKVSQVWDWNNVNFDDVRETRFNPWKEKYLKYEIETTQ